MPTNHSLREKSPSWLQRGTVVEGVLEIPLEELLGVCAFLGILGGLLYLRVWMFTQFNQADDEVR